MITVMRKLMRARDVVLSVNEEYIRSAGTADEYRTEPPFKLQGSYRNMNRIAERVVPVMNDEELEELIFSCYQNDAQTLTTGTESNLLKFKELTGKLSPDEAQRWETIKRTYRRNVRMRGVGEDDKVGLVVSELSGLSDGLDSIRQSLGSGLDQLLTAAKPDDAAEPQRLETSFTPETVTAMKGLVDDLKAALASRPDGSPPQEVHVFSKVPNAILNVLRHQFKLMEGWLAPLLVQTQHQSQEVGKLRELMSDNLAGYRTLITQLEQASAKGGDLSEKVAQHKVTVTKAATKARPPKHKPDAE